MKVNVLRVIMASALLSLISGTSVGAENPQDLGTCLIDNTTGKDRKQLATWIFLAMSSHPAVEPYSKVTEKDEVEIQKAVAGIFMKLVADDCAEQTKIAMQDRGQKAFEGAFELLGRVAMQELMAHAEVKKSTSGFLPYLNEAKLKAALSSQ
jgi:hypothetical protein